MHPLLGNSKDGKYNLKDSKELYWEGMACFLYEHEADKEGRQEDSHQNNHSKLDHPELSAQAKFKFKLIEEWTS